MNEYRREIKEATHQDMIAFSGTGLNDYFYGTGTLGAIGQRYLIHSETFNSNTSEHFVVAISERTGNEVQVLINLKDKKIYSLSRVNPEAIYDDPPWCE